MSNLVIKILYGVSAFMAGVIVTGAVGTVCKDKIEGIMNKKCDEDCDPVNEVNID